MNTLSRFRTSVGVALHLGIKNNNNSKINQTYTWHQSEASACVAVKE
jgi:hypothetical protein